MGWAAVTLGGGGQLVGMGWFEICRTIKEISNLSPLAKVRMWYISIRMMGMISEYYFSNDIPL